MKIINAVDGKEVKQGEEFTLPGAPDAKLIEIRKRDNVGGLDVVQLLVEFADGKQREIVAHMQSGGEVAVIPT